MVKKKSKGAGGKLSRSEIIQARLSPRVRFAAELMARKEKRSLSSMIEILIENASKDFEFIVSANNSESADGNVAVKADYIIKQLWSPDEALRFVRFAFTFPQLLNAEEELRWTYIRETPYFWCCYKVKLFDKYHNLASNDWMPHHSLETLVLDNLREYWDALKKDKIDRAELPDKKQVGGVIKTQNDCEDTIATIGIRMNIELSSSNSTNQDKKLSKTSPTTEFKDSVSSFEGAKRKINKVIDDILKEEESVS